MTPAQPILQGDVLAAAKLIPPMESDGITVPAEMKTLYPRKGKAYV